MIEYKKVRVNCVLSSSLSEMEQAEIKPELCLSGEIRRNETLSSLELVRYFSFFPLEVCCFTETKHYMEVFLL